MNLPTSNTDQIVSTDRTALGPQPDQTPVAPSAAGLGAVPIGGIIFYNGTFAAIPSNWHLCDGTGGTPDLSGLFIIGTKVEGALGTTGGTLQHLHPVGTLANGAVGAGTPAGAIDVHTTATFLLAAGATSFLNGPATHTFTGSALGTHNHTISGSTGLNTSGDALPPYYTLAYIRRMS